MVHRWALGGFSLQVICPAGEKAFARENLSSPPRKNKSFLD
jgi:hypothetical protein